jgi:hypothetical protein
MKRVATLIALMALATFAGPAFGAVVLDFGTGLAGTGGTFTLLPGGNATGVGIPIGSLTVSGAAPGKDGVYMVNALLSFDTRTATNFILINGSVGACQTPLTCDSFNPGVSGNLLSGTLTSWTADTNGLHNATGPDSKLPALLTALGISTDTKFGFFGFSLTTNGQSPDSVISTDIRNTGVPEPSSIVLFGAVLLGCSALIRRRKTVVS